MKSIGRLARRRFTCRCCDWSVTTKVQRLRERRRWRRDWDGWR